MSDTVVLDQPAQVVVLADDGLKVVLAENPGGSGGAGGITRLQDASDLSGVAGTGKGWVRDSSGAMVWTDLATQAELDAHAALAGVSAHGGILVPRSQLALTARGLISEAFPAAAASGAALALTSQRIYGVLLGLRAGDVVTNIVVTVATIATGTTPTGLYVALLSTAGTRLVVSANLKASSIWTTAIGPVEAPLSGPYTVLTDGGYYACVLMDGAFGTQNLQLARALPNNATLRSLSGGPVLSGYQAGQATFPATATLGANDSLLWFGVS